MSKEGISIDNFDPKAIKEMQKTLMREKKFLIRDDRR
jgi:hypothetical protein